MNTSNSSAPSAASDPAAQAGVPPRLPRPRFRVLTRRSARRIGVYLAVLTILAAYAYVSMIRMPGRSYAGPLPPATAQQTALADELRGYVEVLADATGGVGRVGNRSTFYPKRYAAAASWIDDTLASFGYAERHQTFVQRGAPVPNFEVIVPGTSKPDEIVVVGAHYDGFQGSPGADDNASGVAATLALARRFAASPRPRTLRFCFFVNEEPPAFWTDDMGSRVYARKCRATGDDIVAMISVESIGYYAGAPGSQRYPFPLSRLYPDTGDFIGFVGNWSSRRLVRRALGEFRDTTAFPSEGAALPGVLPGVGWSDHWSFWKEGYAAIMVTDTALFRNPNYHTPLDTADTLDYERMARVTEGLERVVIDLAQED